MPPVHGLRSFDTFLGREQAQSYHIGVLGYRYKGVPCGKSPLDTAIYLRMIGVVRPRTIIEIGSSFGGGAMLLRDFAKINGVRCKVVSIDIEKPDLKTRGVRFVEGNVHDLPEVFTRERLWKLPRPWLVIEDSAHTADACRATLDFFAEHLESSEWLVIEDGVIEDLGLSAVYGGGPNRAIEEFFAEQPGVFEIGREYCDMFGRNATYNPNGYLRRA